MKKRFQCWLSQEALAELERRAGAPDKRQAYLERLLVGDSPEQNTAADVRADRVAKKVERAERKAALVASVTEALPKRPDAEILAEANERLKMEQAVRNVQEPTKEPIECSHPVRNRTAGQNWRCTACGYQHKNAS